MSNFDKFNKLKVAVVVLVATSLLFQASATHVGAIRWDAWYGQQDGPMGTVAKQVVDDLSPAKWHYRLPFFAKVHSADNSSQVDLNGNTTDVMTEEINYASKFGIDYWAFCGYPLECKDPNPGPCPKMQCCAYNNALSYGLLQYLENPNNHLVKFSMLLQAGWFPGQDHGGLESLEEEVARYVSYFKMTNYQRVTTEDRPLLFILGGDEAEVGVGLSLLHNQTIAAGLPAPYLVKMGNGDIKADAESRYVTGLAKAAPGGLFQTLASDEEAYWTNTKPHVLPPVTPGWDDRPRQEFPPPWGNVSCEAPAAECWTQDPTMAQLTNHTRNALEFVKANPDVVVSDSILIGAWNEYDEGHWISPSLIGGTEKLEAIKKAIDASKAK